MAEQIPYKPVPTVAPEQARQRGLEIQEHVPGVQITNAVEKALSIVGHGTGVLGEAYQQVGQSYGKLGASFEHAGDELFNRAQAMRMLDLDQNVDKARIAMSQQNTDIMEKFLAQSNPGPDGMKAVAKELAENRNRIADSLKTPYEKQQYNRGTVDILNSDYRRAASYTGNAQRASVKNTAEAIIENIKTRIADPDTPEVDKPDLRTELRDKVYGTWGPAAGKTGPELEKTMREHQDDINAKYFTSLATMGKPIQALQEFKANPTAIGDPLKRAQVYNGLVERAHDNIVLNSSSKSLQDPNVGLDKAVNDAQNGAVKAAKEAGLDGDQQLKARSDAGIRAQSEWHRKENGKQDHWNTVENNVSKMIVDKGFNKMEDLDKQDPSLRAEIDALPFHKREAVKQLLIKPPTDSPETDANRSQFHGIVGALSGLAGPQARQDAIDNINPYTLADMPKKFRDHINDMQLKEMKKGRDAAENPDLKGAFELAKTKNLITKKMRDTTSKEYTEWIGAMQVGIEQEVGRNKGPLNDKQMEELIKKVTTTHSEFGGKAIYQMTPTKAQKDWFKTIAPGASDEDAQRYFQNYLQLHHLEILEGLKKGAEPAKAKAGSLLSPTPMSGQ